MSARRSSGSTTSPASRIAIARRGRRSLALDARTVAILEAHRRRQLEERIAARARPPGCRTGVIFTDPLGEPVRPDSFSQMFTAPGGESSTCRRIRLHDLRHRRREPDAGRAAPT